MTMEEAMGEGEITSHCKWERHTSMPRRHKFTEFNHLVNFLLIPLLQHNIRVKTVQQSYKKTDSYSGNF